MKECVLEKRKQARPDSRKVLVVDDDQHIRKCLHTMLTKLGYEVSSVRNCFDAVTSFQEMQASDTPFRVVFIDLHLPEKLAGAGLCKQLRQSDQNVQIILSSGDTHNPVMVHYKRYGFDGVLHKPFNMHRIVEALAGLNPSLEPA